VAENRLLELLQLTAGLDPELVDQPAASLAVDGKRVSLTAGAVEGEHQLPPQPLA
jgi:hypothetical protein